MSADDQASGMPSGRTPGVSSPGALWRDPRFATYWGGQTVSQLGDRISELALPLIAVTMLHASPTVVGLLTAAVWAPNLLSLVVGAWVDSQQRKRRLLIWADLLQAGVILSLPLAYHLGEVTLVHLFAVALLAGAGSVLYQTAYPTFFVSLVRRDQYLEANSLLSGTRSGSFIVGPALAGGLIQVLTAPVAVLLDGVSFLVSAVLIGRVQVDEVTRARDEQPERLLRRAADGMRFLVRHPYLKASLACATTINFFSFVVSALVILFASRTLGLPAGTIGLAFGIVLFTAPLALLPLASGTVWTRAGVLGLVEFLSGMGVMLFDVNQNALQTAVTPDEMRSRVAGAFSSVNYGIRPLGAVVGGLCGQLIGVGPTMVAAAVGGSLSFLWLLRSPIITTRTIDELEPVGC